MIRVSKKEDYAVFIMSYLAERAADEEKGRLVSAQELADQSGLSRSVVANLLKQLTRAGLLESERGIRGGYRLALPADAIDLRRILEVVSGPFAFVDCAHDGQPDEAERDCSMVSFCPSRNAMRVVHGRIARLLEDIRLSELIQGSDAACCTAAATPTLASDSQP